MRLRRLTWLVAGCLIAVTACHSGGDTWQRLGEAESALQQGDTEYARETLTSLMSACDDLQDYTPRQLCRMAVLSMQLGDGDSSNNDDIDRAIQCVKAAWHSSPDSVRDFIAEGSPSQVGSVTTLLRVIDVPESPALDDFPDEPDNAPQP